MERGMRIALYIEDGLEQLVFPSQLPHAHNDNMPELRE